MSGSRFRDEMIQVAAVAVAIVEDMDYGVAKADEKRGQLEQVYEVVGEVIVERKIQDLKWGPQHHSPETWLTILIEEVGEAAKARLEERA